MNKSIKRGLVAAAALCVIAPAAAFFWYRQASQPVIDGALRIDGVSALTTVTRDAEAVPHIRATSEHDAYFTLGFVHAQDRLWQMEMNRRIPAGRLAEILGPRSIEVDRFIRTLGVRRNAEAIFNNLDAHSKAVLQSYANGVNAWLAQNRKPLPPEFLLTGAKPEPWHPVDSLGWQTMMAWDLGGNWTQEVLRMRLAQTLPLARINEILTPYPGDKPLSTADYPALYRSMQDLGTRMAAVEQSAPESQVEGKGSNNWVLAGSHTASGKPLLANDPHLGLSTPALWYFAHLSAPGLEVIGATLPGLPLVVLGRNARISWGFTNTAPDVQDLFIERINPDDPAQYQSPNGWEPFKVRDEVIRVKGGENVVLRVRESRHGPVISDLSEWVQKAMAPMGERYVMALQWAALRPDDLTFQAGQKLNRAQNWHESVNAARDYASPQQNIVYADVDGNVGFIAPGRVPLRRADNDLKGLAPALGWDARYDWQGFIPFEELPRQFNPASGKVLTANDKIVPDTYAHFITSEWALPYRAQRIGQLLDSQPRHTVDSMMRIQGDTVSLAAREMLPLLLAAYDRAGDRSLDALVEPLRKWDGDMTVERAEPLVATAWMRALTRVVFVDDLGAELFAKVGNQRNLHLAMVEAVSQPETRGAYWCDNRLTTPKETCDTQIGQALNDAIAELKRLYGENPSRWRWGDAHAARSEHRPFSNVPQLAWLFNVTVPTPGDTFTVNVGRHAILDDKAPYANIHAASLRAIYDLADTENSRFMHSTGQSGNVLSPWYRNLAQRWSKVEYIPMQMRPENYEKGAIGTLRLMPSGS